MEVFTQFSSDLDESTKEQLAYGKRLMELLKQPLGRPLSLHEQVITLCAATHKVMLTVDVDKIKEFQMDMLGWFDVKHPEIGQEIEEKKNLTENRGRCQPVQGVRITGKRERIWQMQEKS